MLTVPQVQMLRNLLLSDRVQYRGNELQGVSDLIQALAAEELRLTEETAKAAPVTAVE